HHCTSQRGVLHFRLYVLQRIAAPPAAHPILAPPADEPPSPLPCIETGPKLIDTCQSLQPTRWLQWDAPSTLPPIDQPAPAPAVGPPPMHTCFALHLRSGLLLHER